MPGNTVTVRLGFQVDPAPEEVPEHEIAAWFAAHPGLKPDLFEQEGSIYVQNGSGEQFRCGDQLFSLVSQVCFVSVVALAERNPVVFELINYNTAGQFRRDGDRIELASNVANPVLFAARPLLEALIQAGERYLALIETLWPEDAADVGPDMRTQAQAARAALPASPPKSRKKT